MGSEIPRIDFVKKMNEIKNCIMLTQLYEVNQFMEGDQITIILSRDTFELKVNPS